MIVLENCGLDAKRTRKILSRTIGLSGEAAKHKRPLKRAILPWLRSEPHSKGFVPLYEGDIVVGKDLLVWCDPEEWALNFRKVCSVLDKSIPSGLCVSREGVVDYCIGAEESDPFRVFAESVRGVPEVMCMGLEDLVIAKKEGGYEIRQMVSDFLEGFPPCTIYGLVLQNPYACHFLSLPQIRRIAAFVRDREWGHLRPVATAARSVWESSVPVNEADVCCMLEGMGAAALANALAAQGVFKVKEKGIGSKSFYTKRMYTSESEIVAFLSRLALLPKRTLAGASGKARPIKHADKRLSREQKKAVSLALKERVLSITGEAGCGKSSVVSEICEEYALAGIEFILAAPTHMALSNIRRAAPQAEARTLQFICQRGYLDFKGVLIVDEAGMVDDETTVRLARAMPNITGLVLVGDANQLAPIRSGCLLRNTLGANRLPKVFLTKIFRCDSETIKRNAQNVLRAGPSSGILDVFSFDESFAYDPDIDLLASDKMLQELRAGARAVCAFRKTCEIINRRASSLAEESEKDIWGCEWGVGDPIMACQNIREHAIYNGMPLTISRFDWQEITNSTLPGYVREARVAVASNGVRTIKINLGHTCFKDPVSGKRHQSEKITDSPSTSQFMLSYANTVHRFQGQECDNIYVIIPHTAKEGFLRKDMLYTAITRARVTCTMGGPVDAYKQCLAGAIPEHNKRISMRIDAEIKRSCKAKS